MVDAFSHAPAEAADPRTARLRANLEAVRGRVADACGKAGRRPEDVCIVGVSKYVSADDTARLLDCGLTDLGESRPQLLWEKAEALAGRLPVPRWHMIGHLQRNKLRRTLPLLSLLHSLDSHRLAAAITEEAAKSGMACKVLIEVNLTGDPGRSGVSFAELEPLPEAVAASGSMQLLGLMGMADRPDRPGDSPRAQFARLREARDRLQSLFASPDTPGRVRGELSLGMSGDFEEAILEGSTMVRIGSVLWEGLLPER